MIATDKPLTEKDFEHVEFDDDQREFCVLAARLIEVRRKIDNIGTRYRVASKQDPNYTGADYHTSGCFGESGVSMSMGYSATAINLSRGTDHGADFILSNGETIDVKNCVSRYSRLIITQENSMADIFILCWPSETGIHIIGCLRKKDVLKVWYEDKEKIKFGKCVNWADMKPIRGLKNYIKRNGLTMKPNNAD